jgi:hypothetical protein
MSGMTELTPLDTARRRARLLNAGVLAVGLLAALAAGVADAAAKKNRGPALSNEEMYRCKAGNGRTYVSQAIPPECMDLDVEILDGTGRVVRVIPGRQTLEEIAQQKATEEAKAASAQRDKTLLATYLTVADIERLRDQRIELLEQQNVVTRQYISNLRAREARLMQSVQRYRPYSPKPNAPALPEQIASEIVNTVKGLQVYEQELTKNTSERERLAREFGADIQRFKELKGLK